MTAQDLNLRIDKEEQKNMRLSALATGGLMLILLLFLIFWVALRGTIPPPGEKQYVASGAIDFGNFTEGSRDVNNFQPPAPDPAETPPAESNPEPVENSTPEPVVEETSNVISSDKTDSEVAAPKYNKKPDPVKEPVKETPKQEETPKEVKKEPKPEVTDSKTSTENTSDNTKPSGSNHGDGNTVGNRGTDEAKTLDPNGLYNWGEGGGNLNGRIPLALPQPAYNVQQEARITFEFKIGTDGTVKYVKPPITTNPGLKKAGLDAVRKFRFNAVDPSAGDQWSKVTITFKLH